MRKATDKSLLFRSYLAPKHWPLWIAIGLLRLIATLPLPLINKIGAALGMLIYRVVPSRRRAARINLKQAFPNYNDDKITLLCKQSFISMGISFLEMGAAWFKNPNELKKVCSIEGRQHLDAAMAKNKGVILLTGHFTTLEIGGLLIGTYVTKYNAVFKKAKNPLFNALMVHYRSKMGNDLIETKNVRGFIRGLKNGHATWFAPDQDFSVQDIVFTPFLGGIASTLTATAKMAKMTDAAVVPFYQVRLKNGKGFKLIVYPELENFPSDDIEADSARVNKTLEKMIYDCPEQYLWAHKRFKTQPDGHNSIYLP
ncbi:MAG: LpxL/LpxP family Kdo(2)-lipid IV(A) lauroyl/palmitoleoyl acyltransferase [Proteobacteria bacterium]|nr:LpxL/LpxP family Kdo(2)-lipid IV(A) lauroyl/palmitoleoyl acyltransferase [Pseudomonadota bacterium]